MTKHKTMEITYSGFAQGHVKKTMSIFGFGFVRVIVLSHHLPGRPEKERMSSDRTCQDLNQVLPKCNICRVMPE
jgi:hypothetical protein